MDKGAIAEMALAPAMGARRAMSVVGDLLEAGGSRGPAWFWSNVARTLVGTVWSDFRGHPLFFVGLAGRGALMLCATLFLVWRARSLATDFVRGSFSHSHFLVRHPKEWLWPGMQTVALAATFHAGRWTARRSLGKDLAVCIAMAVVFPFVTYGFNALWAAWAAAGAHQGAILPAFGRFWYHLEDAGFVAAFVLGVALLRRRRDVRPA